MMLILQRLKNIHIWSINCNPISRKYRMIVGFEADMKKMSWRLKHNHFNDRPDY